MPQLSVTVITRNEAARLPTALASVRWADEIVVVDAGSDDDTAAIARRFTERVVVAPWHGYSHQKNHAASLARHDWILSIDADERVPEPLAGEIRDLLRNEPPARGYRIPRVAFHLGRWIRSTDWYPDPQLRLYDRRTGRWEGAFVHESVRVAGAVGRLRHELEHRPYAHVAQHLATIDRYTTLAARELGAAGRRVGALDLLTHPPLAFLRNYVLRQGFRDGVPGLVVSLMNAQYVLLKLAKRWEQQQPGWRGDPPA